MPLKTTFAATAAYRCASSVFIFLTLAFAAVTTAAEEQCSAFNYEVGRRVHDQLLGFLAEPQEINQFFDQLRSKRGFASGSLGPSDRELYFKLIMSFPSNLVYFALEDGHDMGYDNGFHFSYYREPGNSGYSVDDPTFEKHLKSCVEPESGDPVDCLLEAGRTYIKFLECDADADDDCDIYEPCQDIESQSLPDCNDEDSLDAAGIAKDECLSRKKWCRKYTIETAEAIPNDPNNRTGLGYIPESYLCYSELAEVTQTPGQALATDGTGESGSTCVYEDGVTVVQRNLVGEYAYCGGDGKVCNDTFTGAFYSPEYDGRYRPWYLDAKERQKAHWSDPYLYETGYIGLTHVHPLYTSSDRGQIFDGVLAVDYKFEDFANFLVKNYLGTDAIVAIYEDAEPNYLIGASTGTQASTQYLVSDPTQLCPTTVQYGSKSCTTERLRIKDIQGSEGDDVILESFLLHEATGYPDDLLFVKLSDHVGADIYVSKVSLFQPNEGANLKWRVLTAFPATEGTTDTIVVGDPLFGPIIILGLVGVTVCSYFFAYFYSKRTVRAVAFADWKFTCAFIVGCGLLNTSTFTLLGENTDATCLLRMWSFHLFFVVALSPLFVKVWRMYKLVEQASFRRATITNMQAAIYTMPLILIQATILLIFTFVDPPSPTEIIENVDDGFPMRTIVCQSEGDAFFIVQLVLEAGLVVVGCVLAYLQRNMDDKFGEAKHMLVAMYNIALVGTIVIIVINVAEMDGSGKKMLQGIGVLWGSGISAASFVVPRMIQIRAGKGLRRSSIRVSGIQDPSNLATGIQDSSVMISAIPDSRTSTMLPVSELGTSGVDHPSTVENENEKPETAPTP